MEMRAFAGILNGVRVFVGLQGWATAEAGPAPSLTALSFRLALLASLGLHGALLLIIGTTSGWLPYSAPRPLYADEQVIKAFLVSAPQMGRRELKPVETKTVARRPPAVLPQPLPSGRLAPARSLSRPGAGEEPAQGRTGPSLDTTSGTAPAVAARVPPEGHPDSGLRTGPQAVQPAGAALSAGGPSPSFIPYAPRRGEPGGPSGAGVLESAKNRPVQTEADLVPPRRKDGADPLYPPLARLRGYQGVVLVAVEVLEDGTVGLVALKRSSGHAILDQAALQDAQTRRFEPGRRFGRAVRMTVEIPYRFVLTPERERGP